MIALTFDLANELLDAAVAEKGEDFVYEKPLSKGGYSYSQCLYVHETPTGEEPGCIIGNVFYRLGVPFDVLKRHEGSGPDRILDDPVADIGCHFEVYDLLGRVQRLQDSGLSWGQAVDRARNENDD